MSGRTLARRRLAAPQDNAQALQEAYDEIFTTCQAGGPSLLADPGGKPSCGTKAK